MASQKLTCFLSKTGRIINKISDGITSQNMPVERDEIFCASFVSIYIHIKASIDISGKDANILPANELRFDISEISTIITAEINTFTM